MLYFLIKVNLASFLLERAIGNPSVGLSQQLSLRRSAGYSLFAHSYYFYVT